MNDATIERRDLPALPIPDEAPIDQFETYAVIRCGDVRAEIVRFAYWHPNDGVDTVAVSFDARLHVPDEGAGIADIHVDDPQPLFDVAQVAQRAAFLLDEARRHHATALPMTAAAGSEGSER
ncbi:hypothetical protein H7K38_26630 [Mycobacterium alsense]|nr:hypothetical protein [Mycobacterium alsense]MCV7382195.1 hypothetical protein [Mycobacterium alsense]